jgi:hypothetical protein
MTMSVDVLANSKRLEQRPSTGASRLRFSFGLRTLLLCFTILALIDGYFAWNVNVVERRRQLLTQCQENDVFAIGHWEDAPNFSCCSIKDFRALTIFQLFDGWQERSTDPAVSFIRDTPIHRRDLSWLRGQLGDRRVSNIFLTDSTNFSLYRTAFPEAMMVVDPTANEDISDWERATGSSRSQLTRSP